MVVLERTLTMKKNDLEKMNIINFFLPGCLNANSREGLMF